MKEEELRQLLKQADQPPPASSDYVVDLPRLKQRLRNQSARPMRLAAVPLLIVAGLWLWNVFPGSVDPDIAVVKSTSVDVTLQEIDRLRSQADLHATLAEVLRWEQESQHLQARLDQIRDHPAPETPVAGAQAAAIIALFHADRLRDELEDPTAAVEEYRRIVDRYAGTPWASSASRALESLSGRM
jgi:hypothetical protein